MESQNLLNALCRKNVPGIPFCYDWRDENRTLAEILAAERADAAAKERIQDENETAKIIAALQKEKREKFVTEKRQKNLMKSVQELRELDHFIVEAKAAKDLVTQLKLEDERIERRLEMAKKQAIALRAEYKAMEERRKQEEEQKRLQGNLIREMIRSQIDEHIEQQMERKALKVKEGQEMKEKINEARRQEQIEHEAALVAKQKWRQEVLENLRRKQEFLKQQKADDVSSFLAYLELERQRAERVQKLKEEKQKAIERRLALGAIIGQRNWEVANEKEQFLTNLIDWSVKERKRKEDEAYEAQLIEDERRRRMFHNEYKKFIEQREYKKLRLKKTNHQLSLERKPLTPFEMDNPPYKPKTEQERYLLAKFLLEKAEMERLEADKKARDKRIEAEMFAKQKAAYENEIDLVKNKVLHEQPISLLRYMPTPVVRSDYIPQPLCQKIRQEVRKDPIPMLTVKRHQPHFLRSHFDEELKLVKCCKTCSHKNRISNIF